MESVVSLVCGMGRRGMVSVRVQRRRGGLFAFNFVAFAFVFAEGVPFLIGLELGVVEGVLLRVKLRGGFFESIRMITDSSLRAGSPLRCASVGMGWRVVLLKAL
jgi:hypothetical protein